MATATKSPPKPKVTSEWVLVTPSMAHSWLGKNLDNRKIRRMKVAAYAHDMEQGRWEPTHQGVAFDKNDVLRDGQHRLMAVVDAGTPVWMLVTKGLEPAAQRHMDRGANRRVSDFMGGVNGAARVSAARYLLTMRRLEGEATVGQLAKAARDITDADMYKLFDEEIGLAEDLEEMSTPATRAARALEGMGPSPLLMAAVSFPDIGAEVLEGLHSGVGLPPGSPILALRNYRGPGLNATHVGVHTALRVFQAVRDGKTLAKLQVQGVEGAVRITPR